MTSRRQITIEHRIASEQRYTERSLLHAQRHSFHILRGMQRIDDMQLELQALRSRTYFVVVINHTDNRAEVLRIIRNGKITRHRHLTLGLSKTVFHLTIRLRGVQLSVRPYESIRFSVTTKGESTQYEIHPCISEQDAREFIERSYC